MLIEANIFTSKRIIIDFVTQFIKINNYREMIVFINSRAHFEFVKRIVKSIFRMILSFRIITFIIIVYVNDLLTNRDLLFEL